MRNIIHRGGKGAQPAPESDREIAAIVDGQSRPVNDPRATYHLARVTQDAQAAGIGRRLAKRR